MQQVFDDECRRLFGRVPELYENVGAMFVWLTPERARLWLATVPKRQRRLDPKQVSRLKAKVQRRAWRITDAACGFDRQFQLLNGQHRCHVVIETGIPILVAVCVNLPTNAYEAMDVDGKPRQTPDIYKMQGRKPVHASTIAAVVLESCDFNITAAKLPGKMQRIEIADGCDLCAALDGLRNRGASLTRPTSAFLAAALRCMQRCGAPDKAAAFFEAVFTNSHTVDGETSEAARLLSNWMLSRKGSIEGETEEHVFKCIHAFNAWAEGRELRQLKFYKGVSHIPEPSKVAK